MKLLHFTLGLLLASIPALAQTRQINVPYPSGLLTNNYVPVALNGTQVGNTSLRVDGSTKQLTFTSTSADAATNVAVVIDTQVPWTVDDESKLLALRHGGTNVGYFSQWGGLKIGKDLSPWVPDRSDILAGIHATSLGESDASYLQIWAIDVPGAMTRYGRLRYGGFSTVGAAGSELILDAIEGINQVSISSIANAFTGASDFELLSNISSIQLHTEPADANITMNVGGTVQFNVTNPSGYTGAGTLFLSDDGTYKTAGGSGDTVWTNVSGTIQPLSGQTTNRLSFTSGAADDATNAVLVLNTAVDWSSSGSTLTAWKNNNTNAAYLASHGGMALGRNIDVWGPLQNEYAILALKIGDRDPNPLNTIEVHSISDPTFAKDARVTIQTTVQSNTNCISGLSVTANDGINDSQWVISAASDTPAFNNYFRYVGAASGSALLNFTPGVASSGNATAYEFNTVNVLTNGDSLLRVRNDGVDHFRVAGNSGYGGTGAKFLTDDGTYQTASSSATITYTNQFVYNGKVTYNADVYVTNATIYINGTDVRTTAYPVAASDETTALTTGTAKVTFRMPFAMTLTSVRASLTTAQASGAVFTVDVNEGGASVLSTKLTIDNTEKTSTTAATPPVISDSALADDAEMTVDIDQVGDGTATGLKVTLIGIRLP